MTVDEHKAIHIELHKKFDELLADFIDQTEKSLDQTTVMEFMMWSYQQTQNPTERGSDIRV